LAWRDNSTWLWAANPMASSIRGTMPAASRSVSNMLSVTSAPENATSTSRVTRGTRSPQCHRSRRCALDAGPAPARGPPERDGYPSRALRVPCHPWLLQLRPERSRLLDLAVTDRVGIHWRCQVAKLHGGEERCLRCVMPRASSEPSVRRRRPSARRSELHATRIAHGDAGTTGDRCDEAAAIEVDRSAESIVGD
jgi:hypothetical protein